LSGIPDWDKFVKKKITTSDSRTLEEELGAKGKVVYEHVCKVCKKPFSETEEQIICDKCKHYAHTDCSARYQNEIWDHLCIIEDMGMDKSAFKVLYGLKRGYRKRQIEKAAGFTGNEVDFVITKLAKAGFILHKRLLVVDSYEVTYKGNEAFPILEDIYSEEKDVVEFAEDLAARGSSLGFGFLPNVELRAGVIIFLVVVVGAVIALQVVLSRILWWMHYLRIGMDVQFAVQALALILLAVLLYKLKGFFF